MQSTVHSNGRFDVHQAVTDAIVAAIEAGAGEFQMPWHRAGPDLSRPVNAFTGNYYRGLNVLVLWVEAARSGHETGWWATYEQWRTMGAQVRKGERGAIIVVYKPADRSANEEDDDDERQRLFARAFRVFNAAQVAGWRPPEPDLPEPAERLESAEAFVTATGAEVRYGGHTACYRPKDDVILMPEHGRFAGSTTRDPVEAYYAVLLHELTHWSGAEHRLARTFGQRFGDDAYAMEELVAELGAAFLCADLSVTNEPRPDHAAYVAHWLSVLKSDRKAIFIAAKMAKDAADYLAGLAAGPS